MYKLPVFKLVLGSLALPWYEKAKYSRALAIPTLLLVSVWALNVMLKEEINSLSSWLLLPLYLAAFSIFAVTCHRLVLVSQGEHSSGLVFTKRELKFLAWLVAVYVIVYLTLLAPLLMFSYVPWTNSPDIDFIENVLFVVVSIARVFAIYVLGRLCLVFPATAIDQNRGLRWSWENTRHNGWRMAIIVGLYPWVISILIWILSREEATLVENVITALLYYVGLAVTIFALSLTYREILRRPLAFSRQVTDEHD